LKLKFDEDWRVRGKGRSKREERKGKTFFVGEMEWKNVENCGFFPLKKNLDW
jgi:hypothetical protein